MFFLGIDIGGTKCAVCIGDENGGILGRRQIPTSGSPEEVLARLAENGRELIAVHGPVRAAGISCGGPLDSRKGLILSPPNLPGWDSVPVTDFFSRCFGVPAFVLNDANACALAEWRHGAGQGASNMIFCTMGTGFGCGLILNGKLYEGANGNAGEIGHVRLTEKGPVGFGKAGSVEGYCAGSGIAQLAAIRLAENRMSGSHSLLASLSELSAKTVAEAARQGDDLAIRIYREVGEKLGCALSLLIDLFNPNRIVIGSIFIRDEALIRPAMEAALQREALPEALACCSIHPADLGERIGDVAALTVAQIGAGS